MYQHRVHWCLWYDNASKTFLSGNLIGKCWIKKMGRGELRMNIDNCSKKFHCKESKVNMAVVGEESYL